MIVSGPGTTINLTVIVLIAHETITLLNYRLFGILCHDPMII